ncbi:hypothetical protein D3C80_1579370 [compost metagenome]
MAILAQGRTTLVVIEYLCCGIIGTTHIINDAVGSCSDPFRCPAANKTRLREQPGQDDAGQKFVGMEATGMGDEEIRDHAGMRLVFEKFSGFSLHQIA